MIPLQPYMPWKVSMTILHAFAVLSTCLRLEHRRRTRKLWWDDFVAAFPALLEGLNIAILWLRIRNHPDTALNYRVLMSYGNSVCFITINWWSRISLAFAVVRITPSWTKSRRLAIWMTVLFVLFWLGLLISMITVCAVHTKWQRVDSEIPICGPGLHVTVAITVLDVIGDLALIAIPLNLLWNMKHTSSQHHLVRLVFSASVLTLLGSLVLCVCSYANFMVGPGKLIVWIMICYIGEAVSIITSNLLVLVCWFYHYLSKESHPADESDVYITPRWATNHQLQSERADVQTRLSVLPRSSFAMVDTGASDISSSSENSKEEQRESRISKK